MATIEHDAERWGWARAADDKRSRLVRVGDLVEALVRVDERAPADSAGIVLERLAGAALFELSKDGDARPVDAQWRRLPMPRLVVDLNDRPGPDDPRWHKGPAGARDLMHLAWCKGGAARLNVGDAERLAVLEADAVAAFPRLDWGVDSRPEAARTAPRAIPGQAQREMAWDRALAACKPPGGFKPGDGWTPELRALLREQYEALKLASGRGSAAAALAELHSAWGYEAPGENGGGLSKVLTKANAEHEAARGMRHRLLG